MVSLPTRLLDRSLLRSAGQLFSGRVAALAIATVSAPIVARLFSPSHYGVAAVFLSSATLLAAVLPLGYQRAVFFPRDELAASRLFLLAMVATLFLGLAAMFGVVVALYAAPQWVEEHFSSVVMWFLPLGAMLIAARDATNPLLLRLNAFSAIARRDTTEAVVLAGTRIGWGAIFGTSIFGLIAGQLVSLAVSVALGLRACWPALKSARPKASNLRVLAIEYKDYPRFRVFGILAFIAANQLPVLALGLLFTPTAAGFFAIAHRVVGLPLRAVSQSISDAILRKSVGQRHSGQPIGPSVVKTTLVLLATGLPIFSLIFVIGGDMLTLFLGRQWSEAGRMLEILAVYLFASWLTTAFSVVYETLRKNRIQLSIDFAGLLARAGSFAAGYWLGLDAYSTLWVFAVVACIHQAAVMFVSIVLMRSHDRESSGQT